MCGVMWYVVWCGDVGDGDAVEWCVVSWEGVWEGGREQYLKPRELGDISIRKLEFLEGELDEVRFQERRSLQLLVAAEVDEVGIPCKDVRILLLALRGGFAELIECWNSLFNRHSLVIQLIQSHGSILACQETRMIDNKRSIVRQFLLT